MATALWSASIGQPLGLLLNLASRNASLPSLDDPQDLVPYPAPTTPFGGMR
jgi:hypothetical protein